MSGRSCSDARTVFLVLPGLAWQGDHAALETARRADASQPPHQQPEVEAGGVHEQPLEDVGMPPQMHTPHRAGFEEMGERAFQPFAALAQQALPAGATNAPAVAIDRGAGRGLAAPVPAAAIGFRDVCTAPGFLDGGLTVFASTRPRPARRGRVAPGRGFDSRISPASTVRCTSA